MGYKKHVIERVPLDASLGRPTTRRAMASTADTSSESSRWPNALFAKPNGGGAKTPWVITHALSIQGVL
eukprot:3137313-Pleurochrysis_carterae.AAC.1